MATGRKTVVVGQVIDPDTWGNPVWDQSVQQFASDADRTTQFPTAQRKLGAVTWLDDVKRLEVWDGAAWVSLDAGVDVPITWNTPPYGPHPNQPMKITAHGTNRKLLTLRGGWVNTAQVTGWTQFSTLTVGSIQAPYVPQAGAWVFVGMNTVAGQGFYGSQMNINNNGLLTWQPGNQQSTPVAAGNAFAFYTGEALMP